MVFTIVIPYYNGQDTINYLLESIPPDLPVILVDDKSFEPAHYHVNNYPNVSILELETKGYFSGAVNAGITSCSSDVLVINQDARLGDPEKWLKAITDNQDQYAMIGERIAGEHPAWPNGYIQGTFMFVRRDAIDRVGLLDATYYPLWGSTCDYQTRICRAGFKVLPLRPVPGLFHDRSGRFGSAITTALHSEPEKKYLFIRTPPEISVIVPCYNHGRYLPDLVHSLIGGETSLGSWEQQSFSSFEILIVDDASTDDTPNWIKTLVNPWCGVRSIRLKRNLGTAGAINAGIQQAFGRFVTVMGADDMREPWSLETLYRVAIEQPAYYVYDQILAFADGQRRPDIGVKVRKFNANDLIHKNHVHCGIMMPKKAWYEVGGYPNVMRDGREDWAMNVNLLAHGWCGIFVDSPGYLYRREKQNRTLKNTTPAKWREFKARIMAMFPELYEGDLDMGACCGGGSSPSKKSKVGAGAKVNRLAIPGAGGTVPLKYVGTSVGKQTFYGPVTGAQYYAGKSDPVVWVDKRDLYGPDSRRVGMLERVEGGKNIFVLLPPPKAPQPIQPAKEPEPAPEAVVPAKTLDIDLGHMTLTQIKKLILLPQEWETVAKLEKEDRNRKSVISYAEQKANEPD